LDEIDLPVGDTRPGLSNQQHINNPWILPVIVVSQFFCVSIWFAGNGVMDDLISSFNLNEAALAHLTSAVQLGFIVGTLVFAFLTIADRYSPSKVFFWSAVIGSGFNLGVILQSNGLTSLITFRFLTGFFLAGVYPVGMKIAADYFKKGLGKSLGFLVGALVVGTAFPHLLKDFAVDLNWQMVIVFTSAIAIVGGLLVIILVPDGPHRRLGQSLDLTAFLLVFRNKNFRAAAFGYFGHMWELYAFWAFVPVILATYMQYHPGTPINIPLWSFLILGLGGLACVIGGYLSLKFGAKKIATYALVLSGLCCLVSPLVFYQGDTLAFMLFLIFWGLVVIADSPLFSTLVANNAPAEFKGTALTIVNCIGFSITILSIQLINLFTDFINPNLIYIFLAVGPVLGLWGLLNKGKDTNMTTA